MGPRLPKSVGILNPLGRNASASAARLAPLGSARSLPCPALSRLGLLSSREGTWPKGGSVTRVQLSSLPLIMTARFGLAWGGIPRIRAETLGAEAPRVSRDRTRGLVV